MLNTHLNRPVWFALSLFVSACASKDIIIDTAGVDMQSYQRDLAECEQVSQQVKAQALRGAAGGAAVGGAVGAARGNSDTAQEDAGVGAVLGAAGNVREARYERLQVQKNCLRNRGYTVLN